MKPEVSIACERFGISPESLGLLGHGHFGGAWATPRRTVLKVTSDPTEIALIELGVSHRLRGLPVVWQGPIVCSGDTFAYEREALDDLSILDFSLDRLSIIAKPTIPLPWEARLRAYDEKIYSPELAREFPLIMETLQRLRRHGRVVWDLKRNNLGLRGQDIVIRDGRCIRFDVGSTP